MSGRLWGNRRPGTPLAGRRNDAAAVARGTAAPRKTAGGIIVCVVTCTCGCASERTESKASKRYVLAEFTAAFLTATGVGAAPGVDRRVDPSGSTPPPTPVWTDGWMHREIMARVHSAV